MVVIANTSKDARTAASAKAHGLPSWNPAAPTIGAKPKWRIVSTSDHSK